MENNVFIPNSNSELYKNYKVKVFRMVPKNAKLICQNIFTGKTKVKESGFRLILPWNRSKLVNITKTVIDYPKERYLTKDKIYVEIDPALTVRISDPEIFEFENTNPIQELGVLVKDVIRSFIASKDSSELIKNNYSVEVKDPQKLFGNFERRTGLHIGHLFFKNVELPKELVDDYEKAKTQELENARAIKEAEGKKKQAEIDLETKKIIADAEAYRQATILRETISLLKAQGHDDKAILEVIKTLLISGSNANVFANLGNNNQVNSNQDMASALLISALGKMSENSSHEVKKNPKVKRKIK